MLPFVFLFGLISASLTDHSNKQYYFNGIVSDVKIADDNDASRWEVLVEADRDPDELDSMQLQYFDSSMVTQPVAIVGTHRLHEEHFHALNVSSGCRLRGLLGARSDDPSVHWTHSSAPSLRFSNLDEVQVDCSDAKTALLSEAYRQEYATATEDDDARGGKRAAASSAASTDGDAVPVDLERIAVIMLNLGGNTLECTRSHIENLIWNGDQDGNSVVSILERTTYGKKTVAADVDADGRHDLFGPFDIDYDGTCNYKQWSADADAAALASGVDLAPWQVRVYVLSYFSDVYSQCKWRGLGDFGYCNPCHVWSLSCNELQTYVHELGHTFKLAHAASYFAERGPVVEYGDPTAIMGNRWFGKHWISNFNAPHKESVGWFAGTDKVLSVSASDPAQLASKGQHFIAPLDDFWQNTLAPQMLKIKHPFTNNSYYFSYNAHSEDGYRGDTLVQIYVNQSTPSLFADSLAIGDTFVDFAHRFSVSHVARNETVMELKVNFGCQVKPPTISFRLASDSETIVDGTWSSDLSPSSLTWPSSSSSDIALSERVFDELRASTSYANGSVFEILNEERTFELLVDVKNENSPLCLASHFRFLEPRLAGGWQASVEPASLTIVSGQTCSVRWRLEKSDDSAASAESATSDVVRAGLEIVVSHGGDYAPASTLTAVAHLRLPSSCIRRPPIFRILDAEQLTHDVEPTVYHFEFHNADSPSCQLSTWNLDLSLRFSSSRTAAAAGASNAFVHEVRPSQPSLAPGEKIVGTVSIRPPDESMSTAALSQALVVKVTASSLADSSSDSVHLPVSASFLFQPCISSPPLLRLEPDQIKLRSSSSVGAHIRIANRDEHCVPTQWSLTFSSVDRSLHVNLLPETLTLAAGQNGTALVLFSAPSLLKVTSARTRVTVSDHKLARRRAQVLQMSGLGSVNLDTELMRSHSDNGIVASSSVSSSSSSSSESALSNYYAGDERGDAANLPSSSQFNLINSLFWHRTASAELTVSFEQDYCVHRPAVIHSFACSKSILNAELDAIVKCTMDLVNLDSRPCPSRWFDVVLLMSPNTTDGWNSTRLASWSQSGAASLQEEPQSAILISPGYARRAVVTVNIPLDYRLRFNDTTVRLVQPSVLVTPRDYPPQPWPDDPTLSAAQLQQQYADGLSTLSLNSKYPLDIGVCVPETPLLDFASPSLIPKHPLPLDGTALVNIVAQNRNGRYCMPSIRRFAALLRVEPLDGSGGGGGRHSSLGISGLPLVPGLRHFSQGPSLIHWQLRANSPGLYNVSLQLADPMRPGHPSDAISFPVSVSTACRVKPLRISVSSPFNHTTGSSLSQSGSDDDELKDLPAGKGRSIAFGLTIHNDDDVVTGGGSALPSSSSPAPSSKSICPYDSISISIDNSSLLPNPNPRYYYGTYFPQYLGWHFHLDDTEIESLAPGESFSTSLSVRIDDDLAANDYQFAVNVRGERERVHVARALLQIPIRCPDPEPVTRLHATQFTPPFKLERNVRLVWENPCPDQFACCCPCTFVVRRNGTVLTELDAGLSLTKNFTDTTARTGQLLSYSVSIRDRNGRESGESSTCRGSLVVAVGDADRSLFYLFLVAVLFTAFLSTTFYVLAFRRAARRRSVAYKEARKVRRRNEAFDGIERIDDEQVFARIRVRHETGDDDGIVAIGGGVEDEGLSFAEKYFVHDLAGNASLIRETQLGEEDEVFTDDEYIEEEYDEEEEEFEEEEEEEDGEVAEDKQSSGKLIDF